MQNKNIGQYVIKQIDCSYVDQDPRRVRIPGWLARITLSVYRLTESLRSEHVGINHIRASGILQSMLHIYKNTARHDLASETKRHRPTHAVMSRIQHRHAAGSEIRSFHFQVGPIYVQTDKLIEVFQFMPFRIQSRVAANT